MPSPTKTTVVTDTCKVIRGNCLQMGVNCEMSWLLNQPHIADAIISDPPYGIGHKKGNLRNYEKQIDSKSISSTGKRSTRRVVGDDKPFDPSIWMKYRQVAFTGPQYYYDRLPPNGMLHCWDKRGNYKPLDQADADLVWVKSPTKKTKRPRVFHLAWRGICRHAENRDKILHPTQKPVALMEWMIDLCNLEPNSLIVDPFMGVGTTGIAAMNKGHRFVGIEILPEYYALAVKRLQEHANHV